MSLTSSDKKAVVGAKLERFSHDVFDVFRWMLSVGGARYIALKTGSSLFLFVSWGLATVLLIYLMSVFLLRGEITVFRTPSKWATASNLAVNLLVCASAFAACLWLTYALVDVFIRFQEA